MLPRFSPHASANGELYADLSDCWRSAGESADNCEPPSRPGTRRLRTVKVQAALPPRAGAVYVHRMAEPDLSDALALALLTRS